MGADCFKKRKAAGLVRTANAVVVGARRWGEKGKRKEWSGEGRHLTGSVRSRRYACIRSHPRCTTTGKETQYIRRGFPQESKGVRRMEKEMDVSSLITYVFFFFFSPFPLSHCTLKGLKEDNTMLRIGPYHMAIYVDYVLIAHGGKVWARLPRKY